MTFRIAVVQPICHRPGTDEANLADAVRAIAIGSSEDCAVKQGLLGPQWQRPELYDLIHPRPRREAAE
jgi:hypothetical protein